MMRIAQEDDPHRGRDQQEPHQAEGEVEGGLDPLGSLGRHLLGEQREDGDGYPGDEQPEGELEQLLGVAEAGDRPYLQRRAQDLDDEDADLADRRADEDGPDHAPHLAHARDRASRCGAGSGSPGRAARGRARPVPATQPTTLPMASDVMPEAAGEGDHDDEGDHRAHGGSERGQGEAASELSMPTTRPVSPSNTKPIMRMRKRKTALSAVASLEAEARSAG